MDFDLFFGFLLFLCFVLHITFQLFVVCCFLLVLAVLDQAAVPADGVMTAAAAFVVFCWLEVLDFDLFLSFLCLLLFSLHISFPCLLFVLCQ